MQTKIIKLSQPVMFKGEMLKELTVRRINIGEEEDAMQAAVQMKRARNTLTVEMCIFAKAARINYDTVRQMSNTDYAKLRAAMDEISGLEEEEDDDENPMTLPTNLESSAGQSLPLADTAAGN